MEAAVITRETAEHNKQCRQDAEEMMQFIGDRPLRFWECLAGMIAAKRSMLGGKIENEDQPKLSPDSSPGRSARSGRSDATAGGNQTDVEAALELVDEIEELAEQMPSAGQEFAESVLANAKSIAATIERSGRVSPAQRKALNNFADGLAAWIHD
jgi:hypothetical protein